MLTSIDVNSDNSFSMNILGISPKDSILCKTIVGLSPPPLNLFIGEYARDGGTYQGRRVEKRNVVLTMELNPNPALGETMQSLRERLYKAFVDPLVEADYVKVDLHLDDLRELYFAGYTETFDTEIFSQDNMVQISMLCPDPYLRDVAATTLTHPTGWTTVPFTYHGTSETGFEAEIYVNTATTRLILANNTVTDSTSSPDYPRGRMIIDKALVPGDIVTINTVRGFRRALLTPVGGGPVQSLIANVTPTSRWIELHSQSNTMKVYGATPDVLPAAIRSLKYVQSYWGI